MLLLVALFLTLTHGAPLPPSTSEPSAGIRDCYVLLALREAANDRTIWDIIWSCAATILACTWTALHPNIPGPHDSSWRCFKRRAVMTFYAVIAPEVVSLWALIQYTGARNAMKDYNKTVATNKPTEKSITQSMKEWFYSIPEPKSQGIQPWTMSHAFFALMGGFLLYDSDGQPVQVLTYARLKAGIQDGTIDPPDITEDEIQDRSKGDFLSKGIVVLQTSWFVLQCITRWAQRLPLSELEVVTLGFALLNGVTYALWWHKPQDVGKAFRLARKTSVQKLDEKPLVVGLEREPMECNISKPPVEPIPEGSIDSVMRINTTPLTEPDISLLPVLPSTSGPTAPIPNDDEKQTESESTFRYTQPAEGETSTLHPKPQDVGKAFRITRKTSGQKGHEKPLVGLKRELTGTERDVSKPPVEAIPEGPMDSVTQINTPLAEPDISLLPALPSSSGPIPTIPDDDEKQPEPENTPENTQPVAKSATSTPHPAYAKVRYMRRKLIVDRSKLNGRWTSILWFYGVMIPYRLFRYSIYGFLKMLEPNPQIEDGALRVSIFGSDAIDDEAYGEVIIGACIIGTVFGAVHFIAWAAPFPTSTEHLLWRIATVYIAGYPTSIIAVAIVAVILSACFNFKAVTEADSVLEVYNVLTWIGAAIYGLSRSVILFEAVLSLRDLPSAVYQDVEWTVFIPHL